MRSFRYAKTPSRALRRTDQMKEGPPERTLFWGHGVIGA